MNIEYMKKHSFQTAVLDVGQNFKQETAVWQTARLQQCHQERIFQLGKLRIVN